VFPEKSDDDASVAPLTRGYCSAMAQPPPDEKTAVPAECADIGGTPLLAGWFRFHFADERWEWSAEAAQIHGYEPGAVTPTTALIMSHKHPDDYITMAAHLEQVRRTHESISTRHRIIDTAGQTHDVVVVGQDLIEHGEVIGTHGFYIDVTPTDRSRRDAERARELVLGAAVAVIAESRSVTDQTKGMLMLIYGIDAVRAFELLRRRSQDTNVKVRQLAEQLSADFLALTSEHDLPTRASCNKVFRSAHLRITNTGDLAS
jgi:hypothetical protein